MVVRTDATSTAPEAYKAIPANRVTAAIAAAFEAMEAFVIDGSSPKQFRFEFRLPADAKKVISRPAFWTVDAQRLEDSLVQTRLITSVTAPAAMTVTRGAAIAAAASLTDDSTYEEIVAAWGLPTTLAYVTNPPTVDATNTMGVTWVVTNLANFNPEIEAAQTFTLAVAPGGITEAQMPRHANWGSNTVRNNAGKVQLRVTVEAAP